MQLLEHIHKLTLNPKNAARLKELVLELAMRGKLTEGWRSENPNVEPARVLLESIKEEKQRLVIENKIKKEKPIAPISDGDIPHELPENWEWCRLSEVARIINGRAYKKEELLDEGIPVLRVGNLFTSNNWYYSNLDLEEDKYCQEGDLLYAWSASFGPHIWKGPQVIYHYHIWKINVSPDIDLKFLYYFLFHETDRIKAAGHGVSMIHMTKQKMDALITPLPPLAEQQIIVEIVERLMQQIGELEQQTMQRIEENQKLGAASLHQLTHAADDESFQQHFAFIREQVPLLFDNVENIKKLRESILQLAVQGKLTATWRRQNLDVEPASVLLDRIMEEKERLVKEKKIKKEKPMPPISAEDIPYELPESWEWCRLGEFATYGSREKVEARDVTDQETWVLELEDIEKTSSKLLKKARFEERIFQSTKSKFYKGEILYGKLRPYLDKVIVADEAGVCTTEIIPIKTYGKTCPSYLRYFLKSPNFIFYANDSTHGMNLPRLGTERAREAVIAVPPVREQQTIVEIIEQLMQLCDSLEQQVAKAGEKEESLMQALVHHTLEGKEKVPLEV